MKKVILLFITVLFSASVVAQDQVELLVHTPITPEKAVGMIVTPRGIIEKTGVKVDPVQPGLIKVTLPVAKGENGPESFATSLTITETGDLYFSPLKSISDSKRYKTYLSLPQCTHPEDQHSGSDDTLISNLGAVQSLYEIRKVRRDLVQLETAKYLKGDLLQKLQQIEAGFGLGGATPLTPDMNPYELTTRLFRIQTAIKNYEINK